MQIAGLGIRRYGTAGHAGAVAVVNADSHLGDRGIGGDGAADGHSLSLFQGCRDLGFAGNSDLIGAGSLRCADSELFAQQSQIGIGTVGGDDGEGVLAVCQRIEGDIFVEGSQVIGLGTGIDGLAADELTAGIVDACCYGGQVGAAGCNSTADGHSTALLDAVRNIRCIRQSDRIACAVCCHVAQCRCSRIGCKCSHAEGSALHRELYGKHSGENLSYIFVLHKHSNLFSFF